jgi:hypothetical protein
MSNNIDVKQESFCRFTRLRQGIKTADFMVILMDVYEQSLATAKEQSAPIIAVAKEIETYDMIDGFTYVEHKVTAPEPVKKTRMKRSPKKDTK